MAELPTGTLTFLFTDLERSTGLWEEDPESMKDALARHDGILRSAVESHRGHVVKTRGDGVHAVFASAQDALEACLDAQRALARERWPESTGPLRVRMGVHTGEAELRDGDYYGTVLNRAARLMDVGHGGQVLVSESVEPLVRGALPVHATLVDLGVHRLRDLPDVLNIYQLAHPDLQGGFAPLRSMDAPRGNLPRQVTTFVGRERELDALTELVRDQPLVTLTGVGGVGKTRLAVQVAAELAPSFRDGAWLCELAPVGDSAALWDVLGAALGVPAPTTRPIDEAVLEYLMPKRLLLVLDNCEHLLDAVARLVDTVTQGCPGVSVLATSREGLALVGEQLVPVPSLGVPAEGLDAESLAHVDAARLFAERAHDATRDFRLTEQNASAVSQLCRRLDGIPLAIELAAARVRSLTPEDLVERLDQRFRLLTRGSRAALERHQTLRNAIDWSYDLLSSTERGALNRLSVFPGGCDFAAAEGVLVDDDLCAEDVVDVLSQLVDKSLVLVDPDAAGGTRYSLLETIRQYARERLEADGDAQALRRRHAEYFVGVAAEAGPGLRSREQLEISAAMAREVDNFRAALDWAVETGSADHALRLVAPLAVAGMAIGYAAMPWADAARSIPGAEDHELYPAVLAWAAFQKVMMRDYELGGRLATEAHAAQEHLGTEHLWVHMTPAVAAFFTGDIDRGREHAEEWVRRARPTGNAYEVASALTMLATTLQPDDRDGGSAVAEEAVKVARDGGILSALSMGLAVLALYTRDDDLERTAAIIDEAREVGLVVGDREAVAQVTFMRAWLAVEREEWRPALRAAVDAAEQKLLVGDLATMSSCVVVAAISFAHLGAFEPAAVLFGVQDQRRYWADDVLEQFGRAESTIIDRLGTEQGVALQARGASMSYPDLEAYLRVEAARVLDES